MIWISYFIRINKMFSLIKMKKGVKVASSTHRVRLGEKKQFLPWVQSFRIEMKLTSRYQLTLTRLPFHKPCFRPFSDSVAEFMIQCHFFLVKLQNSILCMSLFFFYLNKRHSTWYIEQNEFIIYGTNVIQNTKSICNIIVVSYVVYLYEEGKCI